MLAESKGSLQENGQNVLAIDRKIMAKKNLNKFLNKRTQIKENHIVSRCD